MAKAKPPLSPFGQVLRDLDRAEEKFRKINALLNDPALLQRQQQINWQLKASQREWKDALGTGRGGAGAGGGAGGVWGLIKQALSGSTGHVPAVQGINVSKAAASGLEEVEAATSGLGEAMEGLSAAAGPVGIALVAMGAGFGLVVGAAKQFISTMLDWAAATSPVTVRQFQFALADIQGVLGRAAIPWVEKFTAGLRLVGDVLASILPSTSEMRAALSPLDGYFKDLRDAFAELAPLLRQFVVGGLKVFAQVLQANLFPLRAFIAVLRGLGIVTGEAKLQSPEGAAARPVEQTGAAGFADKLLAAGLASGFNKQDPVAAIDLKLGDMAGVLKSIEGYAQVIATWVTNKQAQFSNAQAGAQAGAIGGPGAIAPYVAAGIWNYYFGAGRG